MALELASDYLTRGGVPFAALPFAFGFWFKINSTTTGRKGLFFCGDQDNMTGVNLYFTYTSASAGSLTMQAGGLTAINSTTGVTTSKSSTRWKYVACQVASGGAPNLGLSVLEDGKYNSVTKPGISLGTVTFERMVLGADAEPFTTAGSASNTLTPGTDTSFAEFWLARGIVADIETSGRYCFNKAKLHKLAYEGPLAVPQVMKSLAEWHSMIKSPTLRDTDSYWSFTLLGGNEKDWSSGSPGTDIHPPLHASLRRPNQSARPLMF